MTASEALKVVVRLLPPEITEEEFKATVPAEHRDNARWWRFQPGKRSEGEAKHSLNARCYLQFHEGAQAEDFISAYHGHQFVDGRGETFRAVACIAPYQKVPKKSQQDARAGTIEDDPVYKEFAEGIQEKKAYEPPPDPKAGLRPENPGETPLLSFLKQRAEEKKARAEKRKQKWAMHAIAEDAKSTWFCGECFTTKNLEEDPDDRGTFYCTYCWETWEAAAEAKKKKKKKKKYEEEWAEEEEEEDTSKKKKKKKREREDEYGNKLEWRPKQSSAHQDSWAAEGGEEETDSKRKKKKKKDKEEEWYEDEASTAWKSKKDKKGEWGGEDEWADSSWAAEGTGKSRRSRTKKESASETWWDEKPSSKSWEEEPSSKSRRSRRGEDWEEPTSTKSRASHRSGRDWEEEAPSKSSRSHRSSEWEEPKSSRPSHRSSEWEDSGGRSGRASGRDRDESWKEESWRDEGSGRRWKSKAADAEEEKPRRGGGGRESWRSERSSRSSGGW